MTTDPKQGISVVLLCARGKLLDVWEVLLYIGNKAEHSYKRVK